jgi:nitrogen regulatory protein P-II 1
MAISEGLKQIRVGGVLVNKVRGRDKYPTPEIHASLGRQIFTPQFGYKYVIEVIVHESKEKDVIKIVRDNSKLGKIFVSQVLRAVDIGTGNEGDEVI